MSQSMFIEVPSEAAGMSPRRFLPSSAATAVRLAELPAAGLAASDVVCEPVERALRAPVERAYHYLNFVMDAYAQGSTLRMLQSYNNESGLLTTGFVYDNALAVIAYLSSPTSDHVRRARVLGDSLLFAQSTDVARDGRLRQAYFTGPLVWYGGGPFLPGFLGADGAIPAYLFGFTGTSTGDVAWVGLAFAWLYAHTGDHRYLDGAVAIGNFIAGTATSPHHFGGYLGGLGGDRVTEHQWASTEHNVDVCGLFQLLGQFTRRRSWAEKAANARSFVESMWNANGGFFHTGTQDPGMSYPDPSSGLAPCAAAGDPNQINASQIPEDAQTWSYLCLAEQEFGRSVDWAVAKLGNTGTSSSANNELPAGYAISGVTFSDRSKVLTGAVPSGIANNDRDAVWLEGTAHLAAALLYRQTRGRQGQGHDGHGHGELSDRARAAGYLAGIVSAQENLGQLTAGANPVQQSVGFTRRADGALSDPGEGGDWAGAALPPGAGVVAASSDFDTGFGFGYFQRQHVGATSWFVMAAQGVNPFRVTP